MPRWRVDIIRKRAEHLGTVEATTEKEAIEKAAERVRNSARATQSDCGAEDGQGEGLALGNMRELGSFRLRLC